MLITGIIPARFASTRFPGKPLALLGDKSIIQRVYEQVSLELEHVFVATDDNRIAEEVNRFGGKIVLTSANHRSGTDRCAEAVIKIKSEYGINSEVVINVQGDEPFIKPQQIASLKEVFMDPGVEIATLIKKVESLKELKDINKPKVITDIYNDALYFSRSVIPFVRDIPEQKWLENFEFFKHIGIYGYRYSTLLNISKLEPTTLEISESLEQLRWIQSGLKIRTAITDFESIGIDTPEDLENAKVLLKQV